MNGVEGPDGFGPDGIDGTPDDMQDDETDPGTKSGATNGSKPAVPAPVARLTTVQYANTVRDLFAPIAVPTHDMPADPVVESFDNNATAQTPSAALIEAYHDSAVKAATEAMKSQAELLGCSPTSRTDEDACAKTFFADFASKAYRRPATTDELTSLSSFYDSIRADGTDFSTVMTLSIEAILQSPAFLYRIEAGTPIKGSTTAVKLLPYELASRLSYLLWNTMPDDELLDAAANGKLDSASEIEKQSRRMLDDARARPAILNFHRQWLRFSKMNDIKKDGELFPDFSEATVASLKASAEKTVDSAFFGSGSFEELLTDDHAWVNDDIADIYGVAKPGTELKLVEVNGKQRAGILTHPGLLAGFAHTTADSPVLRGVFVLNSIMCTTMPPPPPNVNMSVPTVGDGKPMTTRERFETQHEQGTCATCHHTIDGIGFSFSNYDAIGKWRTEEVGLPVNSKGWFDEDSDDLDGEFDNAVELSAKLAASESVHACVAATWMRYALGVDHTGVAAKGLTPVVDAFVKSDLNMRELVVALTTSDAFTTRLIK